MTRHFSGAEPQLQRLLDQAKAVRPLPQPTRARVLRRAQARVLLGPALDTPKVPWPRTGASTLSWLGGAAVVIGVVGAGVALELRQPATADHTPSVAPVSSALEPRPAPAVASVAPAPTAATAEVPHASHQAPVTDSYAAELALLRDAHGAYGSHDFANALRLLAEHGRRFPNGRLAEEREALRVRALSSSGQSQAASVAAHAFAARFPRSVLLSRTMAAANASK
jgi:TolA-binding protein